MTRLLFLGLAAVAGAVIVVWARANGEWAAITIPAVMVPGSGEALEYEARVWAIVGASFLAGMLACLWIALAVWIRAVRRERRLARSLERLEAQIAENRGLSSPPQDGLAALPPRSAGDSSADYDDYDELGGDSEHGLLSDVPRLPEGYDDYESEELDDMLDEDVLGDERGRETGHG